MRGVIVLTLIAVVTAGYGPPRPSNNGCGGGGGGGCSGGLPLPQQTQTVSCGGNGCGGGGGGGGNNGGSGDYWWAGNNSPFNGPPASHVVVGSGSGSSRPQPQPQNPFVQRPQPQQGYIQPRPIQGQTSLPQLPSTQNLVQPPMGICPATYVCVHWQLCRNGFVITDGTGNINKRIKDVPGQIASRYQSCGGDMICCGVPAGTVQQPQRPVGSQPQILAPAPSPPRPVSQPSRPAAQPFIPAPQPPRPAPQPFIPAPQPPRPAPQPFKPAPQPQRPAPAPQNPSNGYGRPPTPQNPLIPQRPIQPNPQPTIIQPANPLPGRPFSPPSQPQNPISNPIGLVSPPSPQPNPMNGGMMMMMMGMPMRGGSCSAGTYCVQRNVCNPYNGFIIRDPSQLMAVWPDAPQVPLLPCFVPDGSVNNGVCCQETHPNAGGFD